MTLEGWTQMMYNLMDVRMFWFTALFFCIMIVIGSFFLLNLILAVIMNTFGDIDEQGKL